jgi:hypothetical protein
MLQRSEDDMENHVPPQLYSSNIADF